MTESGHKILQSKYYKAKVTVVIVFIVTLVVGNFGMTPLVSQAAIAKLINFQGKLTKTSDGTNVSNGTYAFEFKMYDASTSGTLLWTETFDQPSGACSKLTVTNGVFNAKLGSCNALTAVDFTGSSLYISLNFALTGTSYDGEMSPRKQLVAASYAFNANNLVGDGRIDIAYAPGTTTSPAGKIDYSPSVSSSNNALQVTSGANVTGAALVVTQTGTGVGINLAGAGGSSRIINSTSSALILQTTTSGNINLNSAGGTIELQDNTNITGALTVSGAITNATGYNGLVITANTGVITTGTWNGTAVTDTYVADTLTLGSGSSVHWDALNNYPAACSAGSAISTLADTTNTCTAFNTDTTITLQDAYDATGGNTITTDASGDIAITLAANTALTLDAATTDTTETTGVIDLNVDSATTLASAADILFRSTGTTAGATNYGVKIALDPEHATNARTVRLLDIDVTGDAGSLADTVYGAYVDVTTGTNTSDTTYAASFLGGNVGIGTATPTVQLHVISTTEQLRLGYDTSNYGNFSVSSAGVMTIGSSITDGGGAVTSMIINSSSLTNPASKILSIQDNGAERIYVGATGALHMVGSAIYLLDSSDTRIDTSGDTIRMVSAGGVVADFDSTNGYILNTLGVNDTTPDASLEVVNDASGDSFLVADSADGDTSPFVIQGDGDVGIGMATPGAKLEVASEQVFTYPTMGLGKGTIHISPVAATNDDTTAITFGANSTGTLINSGQAGIYVQSSVAYGTKMYFGTTDVYATGSQARMMIDQLGNVGIADITPDASLEVVNDGSGDSLLVADGGDGDTSPFVVQSDGDVGVGTTGPVGKFSVQSGISAASMTLGSTTGISQSLTLDATGWGMYFGVDTATGNGWIQQGRTSSATAYNLSLQASGGNVGIGDATPSARLEIDNATGSNVALKVTAASGQNSQAWVASNASQVAYMTESGALFLTNQGLNQTANYNNSFGGAGVGNVNLALYTPTTSSTALYITGIAAQTANYLSVTSGGGSAGDVFNILSSGNVGIGDVSPAAALVVGSDAGMAIANGAGDAYIQNDLEVDNTITVGSLLTLDSYGRVYADAGAASYSGIDTGLFVSARHASTNSITVKAMTSQIGNLQVWTDISNNVMAEISVRGEIQARSTGVKGTTTFALTGSIDPTASTTVTGVSTIFSSELQVGDRITVTGETRTVTAIASNTSLTVDTAFSDNANDTAVDRLPVELAVLDSSDNIDFLIQDTGNVGIGTSTIGANLDVNFTSASATTESIAFKTGGGIQGITGDFTNARYNKFLQTTLTATSARAVTNSATLNIQGATIAAGTGAGGVTITNSIALQIDAGAVNGSQGTVTNSYGMYLNAQTGASNNYAAVFDGGNVGIGDITPDYKLELHDATTTPAFVLSDDDIAHGVTTVAETDSFAHLSSISTTVGGAYLQGFADATGVALQFRGVQSADPTDTTPAINIIAAKASGTGVIDLAAAETVFQVANNDDAAAFTILGDGKVGIGDTTPTAALDIQPSGTSGAFRVSSSGIADQALIGGSSYIRSASHFVPNTASTYSLGSSGTQWLSVHSDVYYDGSGTTYYVDPSNTGTSMVLAGSVAIGTTSTSDKLTVASSTAGTAVINIFDNSAGAAGSALPTLRFGINSSNGFNTTDAARIWAESSASTTADLHFSTYNSGAPSTAKMTLQASGNLGIGDTSPDYKLELYDATATPTFALSDDDIAHGVTTVAETDSFFHLSSISTTVGGAYLQGIADATGVALQLRGIQSSDPTDTTPAISLIAAKASGTGVVDLAAAETVFQVANNDDTAAITVLGDGSVGIGDTTPTGLFTVGSGDKFAVTAGGIAALNLNTTATIVGLCHSGADVDTATDTTRFVVPCSAAPGDIAEWYPVSDDSTSGEVVVTTDEEFIYEATQTNVLTGEILPEKTTATISVLKKASSGYQRNILGIISTSPAQIYGADIKYQAQNPQAVAIAGRVPVKVTNENGNVKAGDYLTSSTMFPGYAMKATRSGQVIGQALEAFSSQTASDSGMVLTFVKVGWQNIGNIIVLDSGDTGTGTLQGTNTTGSLGASEDSEAFIINQKGSGKILQVQQNDIDRFLVNNNGSVNIHTTVTDLDSDLFVITNGETSILSVTARGDILTSGAMIVKDNNVAGSISTLADGSAEITFTHDMGTGKPVIQLTIEGQIPVIAQVVEWKKDAEQRYTGFVMKTFGLDGAVTSSVVHYVVTGKPGDYETFGQPLVVIQQSQGQTIVTDPTPSPENMTDPTPEPEVAPALVEEPVIIE